MVGTKRERLLDWIRNGDPNDVPVMIGFPDISLTASKLGKDQSEVSWAEAVKVAKETGTHQIALIENPLPIRVVQFVDSIECHEETKILADGTKQSITTIKTPEGTLSEINEAPKDKGAYTRKFFVDGPEDMPAFAYFIRKTTDVAINNPAALDIMRKSIADRKEQIAGEIPTMLWIFCSAVELTSSYYMDQEKAIFALYDNQELMEELMDRHWEMTKVWLAMGEELDIDLYGYAINGLEWLSPALYEKYMIPQAKLINEFATANGKLSWLHTCGKLKELVEMKVHQQMEVDILESLTLPPTGDIDNLRETRSLIGSDIVTRGGINCELMYDPDIEMLRKRAEHVLDSTQGYKHMLGDTNSSYPAYPWKNIQTVIDVVRQRGRLFE